VTTIINQLNKPGLTGWAARMAAACAIREWSSLQEMPIWERKEIISGEHDRIRDDSSALGTRVHAAIEAFINGEPCEHTKEVSPFMMSFTRFVMEYRPEFFHSEVTVWNRRHGFAGTADAIISIRDQTWLVDFKSGRSLHPEVGMQLSALAHGEFIIKPDGEETEMPHIDRLAAIHIRPRSWKFTPVQHDEQNWKAFLACRELHDWSYHTAPHVLVKA
jgi:hypothetical protein